MDDSRSVERQPQGNDRARGVADNVCALDAEVPQQSEAIGGLLGARLNGALAGLLPA